MPTYLMYLRKSRADMEAEARGEGETLTRHRDMLMAMAARNRHYIPPENIYQEVASGESIAARPQVQLMLERLRLEAIDGVYVMELERLARGDSIDQGTILRAFRFSGAKIYTAIKTYDPLNPFDEEYFEFGLFMSRREYKTINRRQQTGRQQSVREGKFIGSRAPYGYRKVKLTNAKGYTLAIQPEEAAIVKAIFDWYLHGRNGEPMGITSIATALHEMGAPLGLNGSIWNQTRIYRILTNEVYTGQIRWGYDKQVSSLTSTGVEKRREVTSDYQLHPGLHSAIITQEAFRAVQDLLHNHGKIPVNKTSQMSNPLSRIVYCSACGRAMLGNPGGGRLQANIRCRTRGCPTIQTIREPVEAAILDVLRYWLKAYEAGEILPANVQQDDTSANRAALVSLNEQMAALQKQKERLFDFLENGTYTQDMFSERYALLMDKIKHTQESITTNEATIANRPTYKTLAELAPQIRTVLDSYSSMPTAQQKNDLLKSVISQVLFTKTIKGVRGVSPNQFSIDVYPALK